MHHINVLNMFKYSWSRLLAFLVEPSFTSQRRYFGFYSVFLASRGMSWRAGMLIVEILWRLPKWRRLTSRRHNKINLLLSLPWGRCRYWSLHHPQSVSSKLLFRKQPSSPWATRTSRRYLALRTAIAAAPARRRASGAEVEEEEGPQRVKRPIPPPACHLPSKIPIWTAAQAAIVPPANEGYRLAPRERYADNWFQWETKNNFDGSFLKAMFILYLISRRLVAWFHPHPITISRFIKLYST